MSDSASRSVAELEERLDSALDQRDAALLELAKAREELNHAALAERWRNEPPIPNHPRAAFAAQPLHQLLADTIGRWVREAIPLARACMRMRNSVGRPGE